jgi:hypothetical protein
MPPLSEDEPRVLLPSLNVTLPVAPEGDTVAVNVTLCRYVDGFKLELRVVFVPAWSTVWVNAGEVLPLNVLSPLYAAVIECEPPVRLEVAKAAAPLASSTDEPSVVLPSLNVTLPVGVLDPDDVVTVTVNVTDCP